MSTGFAATLTGKLKSMFGKTSDNPALPALESRKDDSNSINNDDSSSTNNEFYETDKELPRATNETDFDVVNFDDEYEQKNSLNHSQNDSLANATNLSNSTSLSNQVFSVELEELRNEITSHISISDEKIGEGHALLSKAFSVPDELLSLISPTIAKQYKVLPLEVVEVIEVELATATTDDSISSTLAQSPSVSTLSILYCDEILRQMCEEQIVSQLLPNKKDLPRDIARLFSRWMLRLKLQQEWFLT
ncbi:MAG: hypothetical protein FD167_2745 [bacterium]|nr:MAG: hypothetical protein FD167_2745 [bacterium]